MTVKERTEKRIEKKVRKSFFFNSFHGRMNLNSRFGAESENIYDENGENNLEISSNKSNHSEETRERDFWSSHNHHIEKIRDKIPENEMSVKAQKRISKGKLI
jgi:hypothetical protein